jgi:hypothetical protein
MIEPASPVLSLAPCTEKDQFKVVSGDYNRMIDEKIAGGCSVLKSNAPKKREEVL